MINQSLSTMLTLMINTLLPPRKRIKHSKESRDPDKQYKQNTYLNQKLITREISQKQAHVELDSAKVQAIERASIGRHLLQNLPLLSISLFLIIRLNPIEG